MASARRSVFGSARARSPSRARSLSQASRICPVIEAVSQAALIPKSREEVAQAGVFAGAERPRRGRGPCGRRRCRHSGRASLSCPPPGSLPTGRTASRLRPRTRSAGLRDAGARGARRRASPRARYAAGPRQGRSAAARSARWRALPRSSTPSARRTGLRRRHQRGARGPRRGRRWRPATPAPGSAAALLSPARARGPQCEYCEPSGPSFLALGAEVAVYRGPADAERLGDLGWAFTASAAALAAASLSASITVGRPPLRPEPWPR